MSPVVHAVDFAIDGHIAVIRLNRPKARNAMAGRIAGNGPLAVRQIRRSVRACYNLPEAEALVVEARLAEPVTHSQDAVEGPRAFMEKRKPVFHGR
jgi:enoyl-CoA hydratase/carnithine racemase